MPSVTSSKSMSSNSPSGLLGAVFLAAITEAKNARAAATLERICCDCPSVIKPKATNSGTSPAAAA